ncbi:hypothetical protein LTS08_002561 [Lithohypha guttulata]|uniref:SHSP domain-containing protein n=1 Tax=Lithohypha guttulata TaxID=1690604 RepID=A0AAN7T6E8_9EURO|nr:hypothetical protein LTR51_001731 [Lithohypha guttulata]KAK5090532.1 hypothetical protein LTR05_000705 [Lithohypha guttulata]KAK5104670.1 hypothetical protein LTS08_002561 [Lithohypha guttulata]
MSSLFFRPVVTYPVRYSVPSFFARPSITPHDVAPLFSLFDETFAQLERAQRQARQHYRRPFNPKFDVKESKEAYSLEGELPGFDAKDISIEFLDDGHTLQIKGKTVKESRNDQQPKSVTATQSDAPKAVESAPTEQKSDTGSVKSHQATVEDDTEEQPANSSAVAEQPQQTEQVVAESSQAPQQQVAQQQPQEESKRWISERYTGSFTRSFQFPTKVNQDAVKASLRDGILAITLPFARKPESRKIQIQ